MINSNIILYSTNTCPKCTILKKEMDKRKIDYTVVDDIQTMENLKIQSVPQLKVDDNFLNFKNALSKIRLGELD